jgi:hypothetical protein
MRFSGPVLYGEGFDEREYSSTYWCSAEHSFWYLASILAYVILGVPDRLKCFRSRSQYKVM